MTMFKAMEGCGRFLVVGVLAVALAAACGGDGSSGSAGDEPEEVDGNGESTTDASGGTTDSGGDTGPGSRTDAPVGCTPGTARCDDDRTLIQCDDDRTELTVRCASDEACGMRADGADCIRVAACETGDRWCADSVTAMQCEDGAGREQACPADQRCSVGVCEPSASGCDPGSARCRDLVTLLECGGDGTREQVVRCASDEVCAGAWPEAECEQVDECPAGAGVCLDDTRARVCDVPEEGWQEVTCADGETCADGRCGGDEPVEPVCAAGTARCADGVRELCADDGMAWVEADCGEEERCVGGVCVDVDDPRICGAGETRCVGEDAREVCAEDGESWVEEACGDEETCAEGLCVEDTPQVCFPGAERCVGEDSREFCTVDGSGWEEEACDDGFACAFGQCIEAGMVCTPSATRCLDGDTREICSEDGQSWMSVACPVNRVCEGGACVEQPQVCTPGERECQGNAVRICNDTGSAWGAASSCGADTCEDGVCVPEGCSGATEPHLGCRFRAIMLDQIDVTCGQTSECTGLLPGSVCQGGFCRYTSTSTERFAVGVVNATAQSNEVRVRDGAGNIVASATLNARRGTMIRVPVPAGRPFGTRMSREAFLVESDRAVSVVQYNPPPVYDSTSIDSSKLRPESALGISYDVLTWPTQRMNTETPFHTYIAIIGTADGTSVTVTAPTAIAGGGTSFPFTGPSVPRTVNINNGQTLVLYASTTDGAGSGDLSGTLITASEPVAVFAGSTCSNVPTGTVYCDHIEEQIPAVEFHGSEYIVSRTLGRGDNVEVVRVLNSDTVPVTLATTPAVTGINGATLDPGEVIQANADITFRLRATRSGNQPGTVAVAQFLAGSHFACTSDIFGFWTCPDEIGVADCDRGPIGDPAFIHHVATSAFGTEYHIHVPEDYPRMFVEIVYPTGTTVRANGSNIPPGLSIGTSGWSRQRIEPDAGTLRLTGSHPFGGIVYGMGCGGALAYSLGGAAGR